MLYVELVFVTVTKWPSKNYGKWGNGLEWMLCVVGGSEANRLRIYMRVLIKTVLLCRVQYII